MPFFPSSLRSLSLSLCLIYVLMISLFAPVVIRGQEPGPSPSPSATATPSPSPTPSESPSPTPSPTPNQGSGGMPVHGAPYPHLPNLDALKAHPTPVPPQIVEPVPSVRCSPAQPDCIPEPSPSPSPSPTPGQGQGQGRLLRPSKADDAVTSDPYAAAWALGPTRRLARELLAGTRVKPEPLAFDYLAARAKALLQGKRTLAGALPNGSASPISGRYANARNPFSGAAILPTGRLIAA